MQDAQRAVAVGPGPRDNPALEPGHSAIHKQHAIDPGGGHGIREDADGPVRSMAPHFKSLQTRILVLIAACFLPGLIIFTVVTVVGHDKELLDVHDKVQRLAAMGDTWANEVLADTGRLLKVLSLSSDIGGPDAAKCSD